MALELTVTAKGQITLRRAVLDHLGVVPGPKSASHCWRTDESNWPPPPPATTSKACAAHCTDRISGQSRRNTGGDRGGQWPVRIAVDTNVLVRYLTWDDEGQAIEAARAIEGADAIVVPTIVLCELVWVLKRAYRYTGREIIDILRRFVAIRAVEIDRPAAEAGIAMLTRGGDFAEGVIRQEADRANCGRLVTLDQGFARLPGPDKMVLLHARSTS